MLDAIGWVAPAALRRIQAAAACLRVAYGLMIHAFPVVAANVIVAAAALYSSRRT